MGEKQITPKELLAKAVASGNDPYNTAEDDRRIAAEFDRLIKDYEVNATRLIATGGLPRYREALQHNRAFRARVEIILKRLEASFADDTTHPEIVGNIHVSRKFLDSLPKAGRSNPGNIKK